MIEIGDAFILCMLWDFSSLVRFFFVFISSYFLPVYALKHYFLLAKSCVCVRVMEMD